MRAKTIDDDLNWAAGMFEGEGSIIINKNKSPKGVINYILRCKVPNTDLEIIDFFHERWPGSKLAERPRGNQRPQRNWIVSGKQAGVFLQKLQPYLRTGRGKERAKLALQFQRLKELYREDPRNGGNIDEQRGCYDKMKQLNLRGAAANNRTLEQ